MKTLFIKSVLILCLFSILFFSCNKAKDIYLPEEAKQYLMYNNDSYVILKNDSLNLLDTIKTIYTEYTWVRDKDQEVYIHDNYEQLKVEYYSSYYKCSIYDILDYYLDESNYSFNFKRNDLLKESSFYVMFYNIGYVGCKECKRSIEIELNKIKYLNVLYISTKNNTDSTWASYYFAPNIGLIRKIYHYPSHEMKWDMVSYYNSGQPAKE